MKLEHVHVKNRAVKPYNELQLSVLFSALNHNLIIFLKITMFK